MGKTFESIDESIKTWIEHQKMFFVATAPRADDGLINLSPKGHDALRVIDANTLAYLDSGGSGAETIAHVRENGRIVIMLCAFDGPPKIYRFYGSGKVLTSLDGDFEELAALFDVPGIGIRSIVRVDVHRIQDSCGYGVPNYSFEGHRRSFQNWLAAKSESDVRDYQVENNQQSLDGIPAMTEAEAGAYVYPSDKE